MSGFPLLDVEYETLKRVVLKLDNPSWIEFQSTCKAAHEVSIARKPRYFVDVGENVLSIAICTIRNPVQQLHFNQQWANLDVAVEDDAPTQEHRLHRDLEKIRNRIFKEVHIWQHSTAKHHERYLETLLRTARFLKDYGIKCRLINWAIRGKTEQLSEFIRCLDTVKITCIDMENFDFLLNLPHMVTVHTDRPLFKGTLYNRSTVVKFSFTGGNLPYHVPDVIKLLKSSENCPELCTQKIILNFDILQCNRTSFLDLLTCWFPNNFVVEYEPDPLVQLPRITAKKCNIQLFFGYTESQRLSIHGKPIPIFISIYFDIYDFHTLSYCSTVVDVGAKFSMISDRSQIDFAPKLEHFPSVSNLPREFIQMKEEICKLL